VCGEGKCWNVCVVEIKSHILSLAVHGGWSGSEDWLFVTHTSLFFHVAIYSKLYPKVFIRFSVTKLSQFEMQVPTSSIKLVMEDMGHYPNHNMLAELQYGPLYEPHHGGSIRIWTTIWTTSHSQNQNMDQYTKHITLAESQYGPVSEPHHGGRIRIWTTIWTTSHSQNQNMNQYTKHITLAESQYGPLHEPHHGRSIRIWTTIWTISHSQNQNMDHYLNHTTLAES
jgi:hypothetical protein